MGLAQAGPYYTLMQSAWSIFRRFLRVIDNQKLDRPFLRLQFQAQLLL